MKIARYVLFALGLMYLWYDASRTALDPADPNSIGERMGNLVVPSFFFFMSGFIWRRPLSRPERADE